jgi:hypothetical protein
MALGALKRWLLTQLRVMKREPVRLYPVHDFSRRTIPVLQAHERTTLDEIHKVPRQEQESHLAERGLRG